MANALKQIWEDLRASLFGESPESKPEQSEPVGDSLEPATLDDVETSGNIVEPSKEMPLLAGKEPPDLIDTPLDKTLAIEGLLDEPGKSPDTDGFVEELGESAEPIGKMGRRWPQVLGIILSVGMILFLFGGRWWSRLTAPKPPAENVIATFDSGQITIADVEAHLNQLVPEELSVVAQSPEAFIATVEHLVMEELVKRWATQRQPDADEDFRHTMQHINEDLNLQTFEAQLHEDDISVPESEIRAYYDSNREAFGDQTLNEVREQIRQAMVFEQEGSYIENYIQRLKDNASINRFFELLVVSAPSNDDLRRYYEDNRDQFTLPRQAVVDELQFPIGEDETAARKDADDALLKIRGGTPLEEVNQVIPQALTSIGLTVSEGSADPAWETAVFALTEAELSDVFRAGEAFYIVRLQKIQPGGVQPFEEVRPIIQDIVAQQKAEAWFEANSSQTLFTLKGRQYMLGQFYREYKELPLSVQIQYAGPEGMKTLAEQIIERLLLVEDTYDQLLDVDNQELATEARLQVLQQMLHQEEVDDKIEITDEEIQNFYDDNAAMMSVPPQMRIRYIRIGLGNNEDEATAARSRADDAYRKLVPGLFQEGEDFATVAQEYSEDPETAADGGELPGWIGESTDILAEIELHPFHEVVLDLPVGEISAPFEFGGSLYIVQVIERTDPELLPLEEARPYIEEILNLQKHEQLLLELQNRLLEEAGFVVYSIVVEDYLDQLSVSITPNP
jgi:parvulin-like peptidyl-prolyl isomerase